MKFTEAFDPELVAAAGVAMTEDEFEHAMEFLGEIWQSQVQDPNEEGPITDPNILEEIYARGAIFAFLAGRAYQLQFETTVPVDMSAALLARFIEFLQQED